MVDRKRKARRRGPAAWLALLAVLLQTFLPATYTGAMARVDAATDTVVLCTPNGLATFTIADDGTLVPVPGAPTSGGKLDCPARCCAPIAVPILPLPPLPQLVALSIVPVDGRMADEPETAERPAPAQARAPPMSA